MGVGILQRLGEFLAPVKIQDDRPQEKFWDVTTFCGLGLFFLHILCLVQGTWAPRAVIALADIYPTPGGPRAYDGTRDTLDEESTGILILSFTNN